MERRKRKVQIDEEVFNELFRYHCLKETDDMAEALIEKELKEKLDALVRRNLYTDWIMATDEKERNIARRKYLKSVGIDVNKQN